MSGYASMERRDAIIPRPSTSACPAASRLITFRGQLSSRKDIGLNHRITTSDSSESDAHRDMKCSANDEFRIGA